MELIYTQAHSQDCTLLGGGAQKLRGCTFHLKKSTTFSFLVVALKTSAPAPQSSVTLLNKAGPTSGVSTRGLEVGGGPPRVTPSRGVTSKGKKLWANLLRTVDKQGRTDKKGAG